MAIEGTVTAPDATLEVVRVPMFQNNYGWILRDVASGVIAAVDPAEPLPIDNVLKARCALHLHAASTGHNAHRPVACSGAKLHDASDGVSDGPAHV